MRQTREDRLAARRVPAAPGVRGAAAKPGENDRHLAWVRSLPCAIGSVRCGAITHAHHVRERSGGGVGMKPGDRWAVPLCPAHHSEGHTTGWKTFEERHRVDLRAVAVGLAAASPYLSQDQRGADE